MCLAVPGQIKTITSEAELSRKGKVSFGGVLKDIDLSFVPEAQVGDWVIVHVGFAISKLDEEEAMETFRYLDEIGALDEPGTVEPVA
jgi:hydrogenase expression/formation protein HypC